MSRRLAREYAVQFLYSIDFNRDGDMEELLEDFLDSEEANDALTKQENLNKKELEFAKEIIKGTIGNIGEIDKLVQTNAVGWPKERMAKVDLAILRLALFEVFYRNDVPDSVAVNEAVELAKKYSTEDSSSFINGILGKIIREKNGKSV